MQLVYSGHHSKCNTCESKARLKKYAQTAVQAAWQEGMLAGMQAGAAAAANNGCSVSQISGDFAQPNSVHHYYHYPAIAPAAAAPPAATAPAAAPPAASAPAASAPTATAPAAAPAAAAPPSSEAQQLADMKAMFEQGLIPSREIYEDKVRQILGLS